MKTNKNFAHRASRRSIRIQHINWIPHWFSKLVGKNHGRAGLPRKEESGWTTPEIERKASSYSAFMNGEYSFCEMLLSDLRLEASRIISKIYFLEEAGKGNQDNNPEESSVQLLRMNKAAFIEWQNAKQEKKEAVIRLAEIRETVDIVESIIMQRCDKANQIFKGHIMAYWTGILKKYSNTEISSMPSILLPDSTAKEKYILRHQESRNEINKILNEYKTIAQIAV